MRLTLDPSLEYGVVLEGGGARGAYQIGALKAVTEAGIRIGAVAGASVGALNGRRAVGKSGILPDLKRGG